MTFKTGLSVVALAALISGATWLQAGGHSADAATPEAAPPPPLAGTCLITANIDVLPTDPTLPSSASDALKQRLSDVTALVNSAISEKDRAIYALELNNLLDPTLLTPAQAVSVGFTPESSVYVKTGITGRMVGYTKFDQVSDGHWAATEEQVSLAPGTDCSRNQLF